MTKQRNMLGSAIDAAASLLAGGAAAFLLFAMPEDLLARAFAATGLASFSPKFQPPIGAGLRFALVALAGLIVFAFVWSLMKALDRKPAAAAARPAAVHLPEPEADAPRLRKADAHPDAPRRRPLLAGRDLGEPLDLDAAQTLEEPFDLTDEAEEEFLVQPDPAPAPEPAPVPVAAPQAQAQAEALPAFLVAQPEEAEQPQAERDQEPEPAAESEDSIVSLMARFETGLTRKKQALPERRPIDPVPPPSAPPAYAADPLPAPPAPEPAPAGPTPVGHRLRGAIADLQKVAGR
jgi:hypothetical protein